MNPAIKFVTEFPETESEYGEDWFRRNKNSFLILNCRASNIYYPEHWTPLSIKCAFGGKEYYKFKNITYAVDNNNFLLLNEGTTYSSYINSETLTESLTLNFSQKNIQDLSAYIFNNERILLDNPFKIQSQDLRVFEKLYPHNFQTYSFIETIKKSKGNSCIESNHLLETLYCFLEELVNFNSITNSEIDKIQAKKRATREELYKRLHIAKDYIQSCYDEDISLDSLSKLCCLNPFHLLREFKKYFKTTPHKYVTHMRLKESKRLIMQTDKSITDILTDVGFEDLSSFSKLFKNYFGASPQNYRKSINA
jgi:AraC family transcriptional regulator